MHYFITFRTYGTWLHGDERGSVDRTHNQVGEPLLGKDDGLKGFRRHSMGSEPLLLDEACRARVEVTLREVAAHRSWTIVALNILPNHVHVVISAPDDTSPEKIMNDFKSWATRRLREQNLVPPQTPIWSHHGSTRYLNTVESVQAACHHVTHQQSNTQSNEPRA